MNIANVTYSIPGFSENISETAKRLNINSNEAMIFERIFGLKKVPVDYDANCEKFMLEAARACLVESQVDPKKIKWLIHSHTSDHASPFGYSAIRTVQQTLNLDNALAFAISIYKCCTIFAIFQLAERLFQGLEDDETILLLTGDVAFTKVYQSIPGTTILTDGASAILLSKSSKKNRFIAMAVDVYGRYAKGIWCSKEDQIHFEKNYSSYSAQVIEKALEKANLTLDDIKIIFPHNVNTMSWNNTMNILRAPLKKIYLKNVAKTAHCFGSDPFINYRDAVDQGLLSPGDKYMLATSGLGSAFSAMIFEY